MFDTGARISEMALVTIDDLPDPNMFPDDFVFYPITIKGVKGPGGTVKKRISLISRVALQRTWRYYNNSVKPYLDTRTTERRVFHNNRGQPINPKSVTDKYLQKSQALLKKQVIRRSISPHMFRHGTALSIMASDLGKDFMDNLVIIQKQFGHNRLSTTEVYTKVPIDVLKRIRNVNKNGLILSRLEEARYIFDQTFIKILK